MEIRHKQKLQMDRLYGITSETTGIKYWSKKNSRDDDTLDFPINNNE